MCEGVYVMEKTKVSLFGKMKNWFVETKAELKRVVWPTFAKVRQNTFIVLVYVFIVGIAIWVLDWLFTNGMNLLINR